MWKKLAIPALALVTAAAAAEAQVPPAAAWEIGPWIRGKNYSVGMPLRPAPTRTGWSFNFPSPARENGHVHYVTFDPGSLAGKSRIIVRYRIKAPPGTRFIPQEYPDQPAIVSVFFQRRSDNWSARGRYEHYRWYASTAGVKPITTGEHTMAIKLDEPAWVSVGFKLGTDNPQAFRTSMTDASRVGLVFGSAAGRGHGVFATAPATFEMLDFRIE